MAWHKTAVYKLLDFLFKNSIIIPNKIVVIKNTINEKGDIPRMPVPSTKSITKCDALNNIFGKIHSIILGNLLLCKAGMNPLYKYSSVNETNKR